MFEAPLSSGQDDRSHEDVGDLVDISDMFMRRTERYLISCLSD